MSSIKKASLALFIILSGIVLNSCGDGNNDNNDPQPIITDDSSAFNGRLKAEIRNSNNNLENNAIVYLYATYPDFINNIPLNFSFSNNSGIVDFGFLLQGNYYLFARSGTNTDTAAVQVLSRRETFRTMRLTN